MKQEAAYLFTKYVHRNEPDRNKFLFIDLLPIFKNRLLTKIIILLINGNKITDNSK